MFKKNLKGKTFNRLTVEGYSHTDKNNGSMWVCRCVCGNTSVVGTSQLTKGHIKSCGCLHSEASSALAKHGMSGSPLYNRWKGLLTRCRDLTNPVYGGKGITYDPRWDDFVAFFEDMSEGFTEELEIDRIDVTKGYSKENCRWVTHSENNFNKNKQANNTSGKTGVSFKKESGKFRAYITVSRRQIFLGVFDTYEEAVAARQEAELAHYGYLRP